MVELIFQDGTTISNLSRNGNNYISPVKLDKDVFKNNLYTLTIRETDEPDIIMQNAYLVQEQRYPDGYHYVFAEKTEKDILHERITELEDALIELYEAGL